MLASEFDFDLPDDLIAQYPIEPRDRARLMVIDRQRGCWEHRIFTELPELLRPPDVSARNNTQVVPARLLGRRAATGGKWEGLIPPRAARWNLGNTRQRREAGPPLVSMIIVGQDLHLVLEARGEAGSWIVRPQQNVYRPRVNRRALGAARSDSLTSLHPAWVAKWLAIGLPTRPSTPRVPDRSLRQQPDFTSPTRSSLAWPTRYHMGRPDPPHRCGYIPPYRGRASSRISHARRVGRAILLSATTLRQDDVKGDGLWQSARLPREPWRPPLLEESSGPFSGETQLFIQPGHVFRGLDALITNFHLPRSSLLVLVSAFAGLDLTRAAYAEAIRCRYRFFSYGDAMLIL